MTSPLALPQPPQATSTVAASPRHAAEPSTTIGKRAHAASSAEDVASASFLGRVLEPPSYGFVRDGALYVPSSRETWGEFRRRIDVIRSRKQWLPLWSWVSSLALLPFFVVFVAFHFRLWLLAVGFLYSMVVLGTHGTIYLHRYCTHRAFVFSNRVWRFLFRNLVIHVVSEELYVVSHHVHHNLTERPGDPYNVHGGFLYCVLADVNHQPIAKNLTVAEYRGVVRLLGNTSIRPNSYAKYQRWGSASDPASTVVAHLFNWICWYSAFFALGGHALATAIFGTSFFWAFGIRTFNFDGHGRGRDARKEGIDFNRGDLSINAMWPGYVSGEWHNNHHLYPTSARCGFLPHQLDLAWCVIRGAAWIGAVRSYRDHKAQFHRDHYEPYLARKAASALTRRS